MTDPNILDYPTAPRLIHPLKGRATMASVMLILSAIWSVLQAAVTVWLLMSPGLKALRGGSPPPGGLNAEQLAFGISALGISCTFLLVWILTIIFFCLWEYRASANLHALGVPRMKYTPGWAVGWWFIPIMLLFRPYQVMVEMWRASDPQNSPDMPWETTAVSPLIGWWWGFFLLNNVLTQLANQMSRFDLSDSTTFTAAVVLVIATILRIAAALMAVMIIRKLTARIAEMAANAPAPETLLDQQLPQ